MREVKALMSSLQPPAGVLPGQCSGLTGGEWRVVGQSCEISKCHGVTEITHNLIIPQTLTQLSCLQPSSLQDDSSKATRQHTAWLSSLAQRRASYDLSRDFWLVTCLEYDVTGQEYFPISVWEPPVPVITLSPSHWRHSGGTAGEEDDHGLPHSGHWQAHWDCQAVPQKMVSWAFDFPDIRASSESYCADLIEQ